MATATFSSLRLDLTPSTSAGAISHYLGKAIGTIRLHISASEFAVGETIRIAILSDAIPYDGQMGFEQPSGEWNGRSLPTKVLAIRSWHTGENEVSFETESVEFSLERLREDISAKPVEQEWGVNASIFLLNKIGHGTTRPSELNREITL